MQPPLFSPNLKVRKIHPKNISYALILKSLYFLKRKLFLYFRKPKLRKKILIFKRKSFLCFEKQKLKKTLYFGNGISRTLAYLELEASSQP